MEYFNVYDYLLSGELIKKLEEAPPIEEGKPVCTCSMRFPDAPVVRTAFAVGERFDLIDEDGTLNLPPSDHPFWIVLDGDLKELDDE